MTEKEYDVIAPIGELIDKLCGEMIKCYDLHRKINDERAKDDPNHTKISNWEFGTRLSGEKRVALNDAINSRLNEAIQRGGIKVVKNVRTFDDQLNKIKR